MSAWQKINTLKPVTPFSRVLLCRILPQHTERFMGTHPHVYISCCWIIFIISTSTCVHVVVTDNRCGVWGWRETVIWNIIFFKMCFVQLYSMYPLEPWKPEWVFKLRCDAKMGRGREKFKKTRELGEKREHLVLVQITEGWAQRGSGGVFLETNRRTERGNHCTKWTTSTTEQRALKSMPEKHFGWPPFHPPAFSFKTVRGSGRGGPVWSEQGPNNDLMF